MAGISGSRADGANSIVLSGGYEDDEDEGTWIIYTGQGGNDSATNRQIADQELTRGNLGLARSADEGLPVRVVRGARHPSKYSPSSGFRYDGLFLSDCDAWDTTGGCAVYVFVQDFRPERPPDPNGLSHEGLMEAMQDGKTLEVTLDELGYHYIRTVLLVRRG